MGRCMCCSLSDAPWVREFMHHNQDDARTRHNTSTTEEGRVHH